MWDLQGFEEPRVMGCLPFDRKIRLGCRKHNGKPFTILGDPGAVSRVDKMLVLKVCCTIETSPWALTLTEPVPEAFELPASDFFWPISEEKLQGDSLVFLQDVVFPIHRHGCVARSTGKVSRGKFQNKMLTTRKNFNL